MKYIIIETTDRKHEGTIFETDDKMERDDLFSFKDLNFKIIEKIENENTIKLFSYNYIIILQKEVN